MPKADSCAAAIAPPPRDVVVICRSELTPHFLLLRTECRDPRRSLRLKLVAEFLLPAGGAPSSRLATPDWFGKLIQLESVGGRAPESRCIHFAWRGGGVAYRNGGADAFSRRAFDQRRWHLKVL